MKHYSLLLLAVAFLIPAGRLKADNDQASKESQYRTALAAAYQTQQSLQTQLANLQAAQNESEKEKQALKAQVQTLSDQLKAETTKSTLALQTAQGQIDQFKLKAALLQRQVDDDKTKNLALFQIGSDILTRYEKFSLGEALSAKEPFTQLTRVQLENLVQEYEDKLTAQRIRTASPGSDSSSAQPAVTQK